jgi:hypothetical protein
MAWRVAAVGEPTGGSINPRLGHAPSSATSRFPSHLRALTTALDYCYRGTGFGDGRPRGDSPATGQRAPRHLTTCLPVTAGGARGSLPGSDVATGAHHWPTGPHVARLLPIWRRSQRSPRVSISRHHPANRRWRSPCPSSRAQKHEYDGTKPIQPRPLREARSPPSLRSARDHVRTTMYHDVPRFPTPDHRPAREYAGQGPRILSQGDAGGGDDAHDGAWTDRYTGGGRACRP